MGRLAAFMAPSVASRRRDPVISAVSAVGVGAVLAVVTIWFGVILMLLAIGDASLSGSSRSSS